jgi:DNA-binding transcriptional MerR regulator
VTTGYRIDDLARMAGTTVRNVRAYQDRGLLPPPRREGRVGWYAESHLARLRVIGELLARGYTLANIGELLAGWEEGRDLSQLLGLPAALVAPWFEERASIAALLLDAGVPTSAVVDLGTHLAAAVDDIAARYVEVIDRYVVGALPDPIPDAEIARLTELFQRLRPLARQVVDAELGRAMERRVQATVGDRLGRLRSADGRATG